MGGGCLQYLQEPFFCLSLKSVNHTFSCNEIHRCACYNHTYFRRRKKKFIIILPRKNKEESCLKNLFYIPPLQKYFFSTAKTWQKLFSHMFFNLCQMILSNDLSSFGNDCNNTCQSSQLELAIHLFNIFQWTFLTFKYVFIIS